MKTATRLLALVALLLAAFGAAIPGLSGGVVHAQVSAGATLSVCGTVSAYTAAGAATPGSLTVGGRIIPLAPGATVTGAGLLTGGANVCVQGTLNATGQLSTATVTANTGASTTTTVNVCGTLSAYTAATASAPGSLTISGSTLPIAAGTTLTGSDLLKTGANVCLNGTSSTNGLVSGTVSPNGVSGSGGATNTTAVNLCGVVSGYNAATASAPGSVTIGGSTVPIAAGTTLTGSDLLKSGTNVCLKGTSGTSGVVSGTVTPNGASATGGATNTTTVNLCGALTAYNAATASAPGSVTIGGSTLPIAAGTTLTGSDLLKTGTNVCLQGTSGTNGLVSGTVTPQGATATGTATTATTVTICGAVTALNQATASAPGSITIAGITFPIAAGATSVGTAAVGTNVCAGFTVQSPSGAIAGVSYSPATGTAATFTGPYSNYTAPTTTTAGSIVIGGVTYAVAAGTTLTVASPSVPLAAYVYTPDSRHFHPGVAWAE